MNMLMPSDPYSNLIATHPTCACLPHLICISVRMASAASMWLERSAQCTAVQPFRVSGVRELP